MLAARRRMATSSPWPAHGLPQYVTATGGLVEGNLTTGVEFRFRPTCCTSMTPFLTDIAHIRRPGLGRALLDHRQCCRLPRFPTRTTRRRADFKAASRPARTTMSCSTPTSSCGDGRCNENIALTDDPPDLPLRARPVGRLQQQRDRQRSAVEHRLPRHQLLTLAASPTTRPLPTTYELRRAPVPDRPLRDGDGVPAPGVRGVRSQDAAGDQRPFEHFAYTQTDINAAIPAEFAHAVYRFGHSMLDRRRSPAPTTDPVTGALTDNSVPLLTAILEPTSRIFNSGHVPVPAQC